MRLEVEGVCPKGFILWALKLISLSDNNKAISESVADPLYGESRPNGISCPACFKELVDVAPNRILLTDPPKKAIRCKRCGWSGYRLC